jgi:hypothetical protein
MKNRLVLLLQWNAVVTSYLLTPFLIGYIGLSAVEYLSGTESLRFLFSEPLHLTPWGLATLGCLWVAPMWHTIARHEQRTAHGTWTVLLAMFMMILFVGHEWKVVNHVKTMLVPGIIFSLYLLRFALLFPGLRERAEHS